MDITIAYLIGQNKKKSKNEQAKKTLVLKILFTDSPSKTIIYNKFYQQRAFVSILLSIANTENILIVLT